ncbi:MAG: lipopolysaccharide biosynthesis protein [Gammaproteobacteria bacterium]
MYSKVSKVAFSNISSQAILLASTPFLLQLYSPASFGQLANFMGILGVLSVVASLRLELAIGPEDSDKVSALTSTCKKIVFLNTALLTVMLFFLQYLDLLPQIYWLLIPSLFLTGMIQIYTIVFLRINYTNSLALFRILQTLLLVGTQFLIYGQLENGLIIGYVVGIASCCLAMEFIKPKQFSYIRNNTFIVDVSRNANFIKYSTPAALINTLGMHLPIFAFMFAFSSEMVGLLALSLRLLMAPLGIVAQAISKTLISESYLITDADKAKKVLKKVTNIQYPIVFVTIVIVSLLSPDIFIFLRIEEWSESLAYFYIVLPWAITSFIGSPLLSYLETSNRQKEVYYFQSIMFLIRGFVLIIAVIYLTPIEAALVFSITSSLIWAMLILNLRNQMRSSSFIFLFILFYAIYLSLQVL